MACSVRSAISDLMRSIDCRVSASIADLAARHAALALGLELLLHPPALLLAGAARALDDVGRLVARGGQLLAVLVEQVLRLVARGLGRLQVVLDGTATRLEQLGDASEREPLEDVEHDQERDERPDHQARSGLDEEDVVVEQREHRHPAVRR